MGIIKLSKLTNEELIEIIRQKEWEIKNLRKEVKIQSHKWYKYYQFKSWREEKKNERNR